VTSGYETAFILVPEHPLDLELLVKRVRHIGDTEKNVVILGGESIIDEQGRVFGAEVTSTDPSGNVVLSARRTPCARKLNQMIDEHYLQFYYRGESAEEAVLTRTKAGQTQHRGWRILSFHTDVRKHIRYLETEAA
jgi:hypothetical protein